MMMIMMMMITVTTETSMNVATTTFMAPKLTMTMKAILMMTNDDHIDGFNGADNKVTGDEKAVEQRT